MNRRLKPGDDTTDVHDRPVVEVVEVADALLDLAAQGALLAEQRVVGHVQAEHLLLGTQQLGLVELDIGDRQALVVDVVAWPR